MLSFATFRASGTVNSFAALTKSVARGLNKSLQTLTGKDLSILRPQQILEEGKPLVLSPESPLERPLLTIAPDEDGLPIKAMLGLQHLLHYRIHVEPELCHPLWNDVKNSIRRSGMQSSLMKGVVMSHINHGPYQSGANMQVKLETLTSLVHTMSSERFYDLQEMMACDRSCEADDPCMPQSPLALLSEPTVQNRGIFAKYKSWLQSLVALHVLDTQWSLSEMILDEIVSKGGFDSGLDGLEPGESNDEADGEADEPAEEPVRAGGLENPTTKAEMDELRKHFQNSVHLCQHFYGDRELQIDFRILYEGGKEIIDEFVKALEMQSGGQDNLRSMCRVFYDSELLHSLGVSNTKGASYVLTPEEVAEKPWLCDELDRMQRYFDYTMEICSARAWSQIQFVMLLPHNLSLVYHPNHQQRAPAMQHIKSICEATLQAEAVVTGQAESALDAAAKRVLRTCLTDMGWSQTQIGRECMAVLREARYDPTDDNLRLQAFLLHARPQNTKFHLEDTFAGLADVVKRNSKSAVMTRWTKYYHAAHNPTLKPHATKWPLVQPTESDVANATGKHYGARNFNVTASVQPEEFVTGFTVQKLKKLTKKAGTASNQRSAAATALLTTLCNSPVPVKFRHISTAWAGLADHLSGQQVVTNLMQILLEYYVVDPEKIPPTPTWIFLSSLGADNPWKVLPMELLHPLATPPHLQRKGILAAFRVTGKPEDLVAASICSGIFLTKQQLLNLMEHERIPKPPRGSGSGKRGNLTKPDFASKVVEHFYPTASDADKTFMIDAIMGGPKSKLDLPCPEEVLLAMEHMDEENSKEFEPMRKLALQQTKINQDKKKKAAQTTARGKAGQADAEVPAAPEEEPALPADVAAGSSQDPAAASRAPPATVTERKNFTPAELKPLIPGSHQKASLSVTWGGVKKNLSEAEALRDVLAFLWNAHADRRPQHRQQTRPTWEQIRRVVADFDAQTGILGSTKRVRTA
ncbi:unnamed protein product [Symbiodinium sp. CCMP2592]|nr:unnamed protein product [Symbiodinium sp. CCMP2592]